MLRWFTVVYTVYMKSITFNCCRLMPLRIKHMPHLLNVLNRRLDGSKQPAHNMLCAGEAGAIAAGRGGRRRVHRLAQRPHDLGRVLGAEDRAPSHNDIGASLRCLL